MVTADRLRAAKGPLTLTGCRMQHVLRSVTVHVDQTIALVGDVLGAVAAAAAIVTVILARQTVIVARAAREEADAASKDAAEDRRRVAEQAAAERAEVECLRTIRRVERVGEIVEELYGHVMEALRHPTGPDAILGAKTMRVYEADTDRLRVALVGFSSALPRCAEVSAAQTGVEASRLLPAAQAEVLLRLDHLHVELQELRSASRSAV